MKQLLILLPTFSIFGGAVTTPTWNDLQAHYEKTLRFYQSLEAKYQILERRLDSLEKNAPYAAVPNLCNGRLTLESGTPITTTDQQNKTTIYFTPYNGDKISLYDGSNWKVYTFTERSIALSGLSAGQVRDIFLYDNAGTLTLELSNAWSSPTARSQALTTQNGVYVKSGATTRRYLGTFLATGTNQTWDDETHRFLWNNCNRVPRYLYYPDSSESRTLEGDPGLISTNINFEFVLGLSEVLVSIKALSSSEDIDSAGTAFATVIGLDADNVNSNLLGGGDLVLNAPMQYWGEYVGYPGQGWHFAYWLEYCGDSGSCKTWGLYGSDSNSQPYIQSGMVASFDG